MVLNYNMRKDLIIGAVANYTKDKIVEYVQSINKCGFTGDRLTQIMNLINELPFGKVHKIDI